MSFFKKLLYDPGAEPLKTFNWNYSLQLYKEKKKTRAKWVTWEYALNWWQRQN